MVEEKNTCVECGCDLDEESGKCPHCEPPAPKWMRWIVYGLIALFLIGLLVRLVWPG